ncbi:VirB8 protein [Rickettsia prowazekii str. GvF12]|nr:VirB8 protein [Rickettsia prowazekii str. GvF12]
MYQIITSYTIFTALIGLLIQGFMLKLELSSISTETHGLLIS